MKLAIISDTHFGFAPNTEREEDSFIQAREAVNKALEEEVDLILLVGDIFDSRVPTQNVLGKVMKIFLKPLTAKNNGVSIESLIGKNEEDISKVSLNGTPVIAIHGTHERRGKGLTNPVQILEKAGLLIHLHCNSIVLKKGDERVAVHGMSGVPERYAKTVLEKWDPKPVNDALNILLMHQSISQYLYSKDEPATLNLEDLPKGFDFIVNGHIHWNDSTTLQKTKFIIPGSTIRTQLRKIEAEKPKGFYIINKTELGFRELQTPRDFYYKEIDFQNSKPDEVLEKIESELKSIKPSVKKPLVRIALKGTLEKGFEREDLDLNKINKEFWDKLIIHMSKEKISSKTIAEKEHLLETFRKKQLSVDELGLELLRKHLKELDYNKIQDSEELLNQLVTGNTDMVYTFLKQKNEKA